MSKSHRNCVVPNCSNRRDRCKWGLFPSAEKVGGRHVYVKRRLCGTDNCGNESDICRSVSFARIPKDSDRRRALRQQWLKKIPRQNIPLSSHSCVCSVHFVGGVCDFRRGDVPRIFERHYVLPQARWTRTSMDGLTSGLTPSRSRTSEVSAGRPEHSVVEDDKERVEMESVLADHFYTKKSADFLQHTVEKQSQTIAELQQQLQAAQLELEKRQKELKSCKLAYDRVRTDPVLFRFYTGVTVDSFDKIKTLLGTAPQQMDYTGTKSGDHDGKNSQCTSRKLSLDDELLLALIKLRHNFPESDLASRFAISQSTVSRTFSTWILCLYHTFREIATWPSQRLVDLHMPPAFKEKYPTTRVVIDCTEFFMEKPANPDVQAATWSNYKNTNTFKLLVGVTPNGVISFLSPLWGGRISDKEITKRSGLLDLLEKNDTIMADRGFDIASIMPPGTSVNIPPFLGAHAQFSEEELVATRRIASLRIHVERAMERIKNFQITHFFQASLCPMAEAIIYVCAFLTILDPPLLPQNVQT